MVFFLVVVIVEFGDDIRIMMINFILLLSYFFSMGRGSVCFLNGFFYWKVGFLLGLGEGVYLSWVLRVLVFG